MAKPGILYISYDGMLEPLGQSQVLAYLEKLAQHYAIHIISFEKKADWANKVYRKTVAERIDAAGIGWIPLRYHKVPTAPATAFDVALGTIAALWVVLRRRIVVVHARSYIPALIALTVKKLLRRKFLFDMRGLWADERVDAGLWPREGRLYRMTKALERHLILGADHIVTLTRASVEEIRSFAYMDKASAPIEVISTCADLERFSPEGPPAARPFVMGYVGSIGTWYLFDEALACFQLALEVEPDARLLIVNRNEQAFARERIAAAGIDPAKVEIISAQHSEMPAMIRRMSVGIVLIKPSYSKIASAPTKLAEFLGCGIPCLGNRKVGDVATILDSHRVGVVLRGLTAAEMRIAVKDLIALSREKDIQQRCRKAAISQFSLDEGVAAYDRIYRRLAAALPTDRKPEIV